MNAPDAIIEACGGQTALAGLLDCPVQTVHSWKALASIPMWRREAIAQAADEAGIILPLELRQYLEARRSKASPARHAA